MLKLAFPMILAVAAGVSLVVQQALNANLRYALNSAAWSGFMSYLVGVICMAAFALAWTPCTGPTLGAIITAAGASGSAAHGAFLLAVYCAGLAVPFLITGLAFGTMTSAFGVVRRHYAMVIGAGGVVLIGMGVLIWTGEFTQLNITVNHWLQTLGLPDFNSDT